MHLSQADVDQIKAKGFAIEQIEAQLDLFLRNNFHLHIEAPCIVGNGIFQISSQAEDIYIELFKNHRERFSKFVPASGAASRMFKPLAQYLAGNTEQNIQFVTDFFKHIEDFAFCNDLKKALVRNGNSLEQVKKESDYTTLISVLLSENGLNYSTLAKGLIPFHHVQHTMANAIEEQLREAEAIAQSVHFTAPPEQLSTFRNVVERYVSKSHLSLHVTFSTQDSHTNTLAVTAENKPFKVDGEIIFRPAGHGALLKNLNDIKGDIVFLKNIDNIQKDQSVSIHHKQRLGGFYLFIENMIHTNLTKMSANTFTEADKANLLDFLKTYASHEISPALNQTELFELLNRPLRVCGMVKNQGEPGGGPFWVKKTNGVQTAQIVEMSQIDLQVETQARCVQNATHFNPVDLVCGVRNFQGKLFNLHEFSDPSAVFISEKSHDGQVLKALELPGLWNGAMAEWLTVFVEVPLETFSPVKTVLDLLKPAHQ